MDSLTTLAIEQCPNVETVVTVGMSAGARMIQRYVLVSQLDQDYVGEVRFVYIAISPAHYAYIGPERRVGESWDEFEIPSGDDLADCPTYNFWPFGSEEMYSYFEDLQPDSIRAQFYRRTFTLVIGTADTTLLEGSNQHSCHADLGGEHDRMERGTIWWNHLDYTYDPLPANFEFHHAEGLGHSGNIYFRERVRYFIFDHFSRFTAGEEVDYSLNLEAPATVLAGENLDVSLSLTNNMDETRTADVWLELIAAGPSPDSHLGWMENYLIDPDFQLDLDEISFEVPEDFSPGDAELHLRAGKYPDVVVADMTVPVVVEPVSVDSNNDPAIPQYDLDCRHLPESFQFNDDA